MDLEKIKINVREHLDEKRYAHVERVAECAKRLAKIHGENEENVVKDANGNILQNGDSVTIIKDLKVKGASNDLKRGTKVKNIRLIDDGIHNIDCKIDGFGAMKLKSEFVKKN